jgi:hypothetical protein
MNLGTSLTAFTLFHVVVSLVAMGAGAVVVYGLLQSRILPRWTELFLTTAVLTSVTALLFPSKGVDPARIVAVISLAVLAFAVIALYRHRLEGGWRSVYVVSTLVALYFDVFVGVIQAFMKIEFLRVLAPTQKEPPFVAAQLIVLILFVWVGVLAVKRFHPRASSMDNGALSRPQPVRP